MYYNNINFTAEAIDVYFFTFQFHLMTCTWRVILNKIKRKNNKKKTIKNEKKNEINFEKSRKKEVTV